MLTAEQLYTFQEEVMKFLMALALLVGPAAFAGERVELLKKDSAVVVLEQPSRVETSEMCPPNVTCVTNGTNVKLTYMMPGCLDRLGPVSFKAITGKKKVTLLVSAIAIENRDSAVVKCFAPTYDSVVISLVGSFLPVEIVNLKNAVSP